MIAPPRRCPNGEPSVSGHSSERDSSEVPSKVVRQYTADKRYLKCRRYDSEENGLQDERDASKHIRYMQNELSE